MHTLALQIIPNADQLGQLSAVASSTLTPVWVWASDFFIIIMPTLLLVVFARYGGRGPFIALVTSFYVAYALFVAFPFMEYLPTAPALTAFASQVALYLAFLIISYLVLRRVSASDFVHVSTFGLLLVSFATSGFIMVLLYYVFPTHAIYPFSPAVDQLFAPKQLFYAWFAAPILALFLFAH